MQASESEEEGGGDHSTRAQQNQTHEPKHLESPNRELSRRRKVISAESQKEH